VSAVFHGHEPDDEAASARIPASRVQNTPAETDVRRALRVSDLERQPLCDVHLFGLGRDFGALFWRLEFFDVLPVHADSVLDGGINGFVEVAALHNGVAIQPEVAAGNHLKSSLRSHMQKLCRKYEVLARRERTGTLFEMKRSVGIDEAGRGCVLGSLVVGCVVADESDRRWFAKHHVRDSKIVPPLEREQLARAIKERCWTRLSVATAPMIDLAVRDRMRTLNGLELEMMAQLISNAQTDHLDHDLRAVIDAPSINAERFRMKLLAASTWKEPKHLIARHRADVTDRTVAAASLIAKDERERLLAELKTELGIDFGCGYPHDEATRAFLKTCPEDAPYVRWSWKTAAR
jgi:ribonuclease HII